VGQGKGNLTSLKKKKGQSHEQRNIRIMALLIVDFVSRGKRVAKHNTNLTSKAARVLACDLAEPRGSE
jgi:hypothetical protein